MQPTKDIPFPCSFVLCMYIGVGNKKVVAIYLLSPIRLWTSVLLHRIETITVVCMVTAKETFITKEPKAL